MKKIKVIKDKLQKQNISIVIKENNILNVK